MPVWTESAGTARLTLRMTGDWIAQAGSLPAFPADRLGTIPPGQGFAISMDGVGNWDAGLIVFLWDAKRAAAAAKIAVDWSQLPDAAQKLLLLLPDRVDAPDKAMHYRFAPFNAIGGYTIGAVTELGAVAELLGTALLGLVSALRGRARVRAEDVLANIRDAGPSALIIVSIVNFLVGAILAFVGAAQLKKFAAGIYVANLVGLAMVREMSAVMTAIVMAGRTGGAYAARIATMEGGEEIDALKVIGIPVSDYILLPSILALILTMPFLYLYGCLVGVVGGLIVSIGMLNISVAGYLHQTVGAVSLGQFVFGFVKSIAFAILIATTSCRIGLKAGRSAADVGNAATQAVVIGIVGVIALDALFAVIADAVGI